jgi:hypothetical protein
MFAAFRGEQQAVVAIVAAACIFECWGAPTDLTVSDEAG